MNIALADEARSAIRDTSFDAVPHHCERFAREVVQSVYKDAYDDIYRATARLTALAWQQAGLARTADEIQSAGGICPGDLLYKTEGDGPDGHVGIYVGAEGVAENSSTPIGRVRGACGYRTLGQWGHIDLIVRLPDPQAYCAIVLNGRVIASQAPVIRDETWCPVRAWSQAMGFTCDWNEGAKQVSFDGSPLTGEIRLIGGHAYARIRDLAVAAGLSCKPLGIGVSVGKA